MGRDGYLLAWRIVRPGGRSLVPGASSRTAVDADCLQSVPDERAQSEAAVVRRRGIIVSAHIGALSFASEAVKRTGAVYLVSVYTQPAAAIRCLSNPVPNPRSTSADNSCDALRTRESRVLRLNG